ncbi:hypothetical protein GCM10023238_36790 [Streptomyces heliomycini]
MASQITVLHRRQAPGSSGPVESGPACHEWAQTLALLGDPAEVDPVALAEARRLGPDSDPTRALLRPLPPGLLERIGAVRARHVEDPGAPLARRRRGARTRARRPAGRPLEDRHRLTSWTPS